MLKLITFALAAALIAATIFVTVTAARAEHPTQAPLIHVTVNFCPGNNDLYSEQWIRTPEPEIAIAYIRMAFGFIEPRVFRAIVVALRPDMAEIADAVITDCYTAPGQVL